MQLSPNTRLIAALTSRCVLRLHRATSRVNMMAAAAAFKLRNNSNKWFAILNLPNPSNPKLSAEYSTKKNVPTMRTIVPTSSNPAFLEVLRVFSADILASENLRASKANSFSLQVRYCRGSRHSVNRGSNSHDAPQRLDQWPRIEHIDRQVRHMPQDGSKESNTQRRQQSITTKPSDETISQRIEQHPQKGQKSYQTGFHPNQ